MRLELSSVSGPARVGRRATRRCLAALGVSPGRSRRISPHGTYCDTWLWVARPHTMSKRNTELGMGTNESGKAIHEVGGGGVHKAKRANSLAQQIEIQFQIAAYIHVRNIQVTAAVT